MDDTILQIEEGMDVSKLELQPDVQQGDRQYTAVTAVYNEIVSCLAKLKVAKAREAKQRLIERIAEIGQSDARKDRKLDQELSKFKENVDFDLLEKYLEAGDRFLKILSDTEKDVGEFNRRVRDVGSKRAFDEEIEDLDLDCLRELDAKIKSNLERYPSKTEFEDLAKIYEARKKNLSKIITLDDNSDMGSVSEEGATDLTRDERISPGPGNMGGNSASPGPGNMGGSSASPGSEGARSDPDIPRSPTMGASSSSEMSEMRKMMENLQQQMLMQLQLNNAFTNQRMVPQEPTPHRSETQIITTAPQFKKEMIEELPSDDPLAYFTWKTNVLNIIAETRCNERTAFRIICHSSIITDPILFARVQSAHDLTTMWSVLETWILQPELVQAKLFAFFQNSGMFKKSDYPKIITELYKIINLSSDAQELLRKANVDLSLLVHLVLARVYEGERRKLVERMWEMNTSQKILHIYKYFENQWKFESMNQAVIAPHGPNNADNKKGNGKPGNNQKRFAGNVNATERKSKKECWLKSCSESNRNHFTTKCKGFLDLNESQRYDQAKEASACLKCLNVGHKLKDCNKNWTCNVDKCGKDHHYLLHRKNNQQEKVDKAEVNTVNVEVDVSKESEKIACSTNAHDLTKKGCTEATVMIQQLCIRDKKAIILWDGGANCNLIRREFAQKLGLKSERCKIAVGGIGGTKPNKEDGRMYYVPLVDNLGQTWIVDAIGMESITGEHRNPEPEACAKAFRMDRSLFHSITKKPVDVIIGCSALDIHPTKVKSNNGITLFQSSFGTGWFCAGRIPQSLATKNDANYAFCYRVQSIRVVDENFLEGEKLITDLPPRCNGCRQCKECSERATALSWKDQNEMESIEKNLSFDPIKKKWIAAYPFTEDPSVLGNNHKQALAMVSKMENRLERQNLREDFNQVFKDSVNRGVFQEISKEEDDAYNGPKFYISMVEAFKQSSKSTPLRICMNSSMKFMGKSLNTIMSKGPATLNCLVDVLLSWRLYPVAFTKDIAKFYNSVDSVERDWHVRRIIWRFKTDEPWRTYITKVVNFGDRAAGSITMLCLRKTAQKNYEMNPRAAEKLLKLMYSDDLTAGGENEAESIEDSESIDGIIKKGGFNTKETIHSGDDVPALKVLGIVWHPKEDKISINCKINVSRKMKGLRESEDIDMSQADEDLPDVMTKREMWSAINGIYDPLGLLSPLTIRLKLMMREVCESQGKDASYDSPVNGEIRKKLVETAKELGAANNIMFSRAVKPKGAQEKPQIICFTDASWKAYGCCVYVRYKLPEGQITCQLMTSKVKTAQTKGMTIPRLELMAAQLGTKVVTAMQYSIGLEDCRRFFITDSSSTLGMIKSGEHVLATFAAHRVAEIKHKTSVDEWFHCSTEENIADLLTRGLATAEDVKESSRYQIGCDWMKKEPKDWPLRSTFKKDAAPLEEMNKDARQALVVDGIITEEEDATAEEKFVAVTSGRDRKAETNLTLPFETTKYRSLTKAAGVMYNVLLFVHRCSTKFRTSSTRSDWNVTRDDVRDIIIGVHQEEEKRNIKSYVSMNPCFEEKNIPGQCNIKYMVLQGRSKDLTTKLYDRQALPALNYQNPISQLIMQEAHDKTHGDAERTLARSMRMAWISRGRRLAVKVVKNCAMCRKVNAKPAIPRMAAPRPARYIPEAPWTNVNADIFGPISCFDHVKRRTERPGYAMIIVDPSTGAVHLEAMDGLSTNSAWLAFDNFFNRRGIPTKIVTDPGSQLVAVCDRIRNWRFDGPPPEWEIIPTASQHWNGSAERMVAVCKKALSRISHGRRLSFPELASFLVRVEGLVNSRPIGLPARSEDFHAPLTPNMLLMGRANPKQARTDVEPTATKLERVKYVSDLTTQFWRRFTTEMYPTLQKAYKWNKDSVNLEVGDVVLIRSETLVTQRYRLGRIEEVETSSDGIVRAVKVAYRNPNEAFNRITRQCTQNISFVLRPCSDGCTHEKCWTAEHK